MIVIFFIHAVVTEVPSIKQVPWEAILQFSPKNMILSDIDGTIVGRNTVKTVGSTLYSVLNYQSIASFWTSKKTTKEWFYSRGVMCESNYLIDPNISNIFKKAQHDGHIVWAYTNVKTGPIDGTSTAYEQRIYRKLDIHGISCSPITWNGNEIEHVDLKSCETAHPAGYKGIWFNDQGYNGDKAIIFRESILPFLEDNPDYKSLLFGEERSRMRIIILDDILDHVRDIVTVCNARKIPALGYHINPYMEGLDEEGVG